MYQQAVSDPLKILLPPTPEFVWAHEHSPNYYITLPTGRGAQWYHFSTMYDFVIIIYTIIGIGGRFQHIIWLYIETVSFSAIYDFVHIGIGGRF